MKKMILSNLAFVVFAILVSWWWYGWEITKHYHLFDYIGIALILTAQKLLKNKNILTFPIYIIGLLFNIGFGIMAQSIILIMFSVYSIVIFINNWRAWKNDEKRVLEAKTFKNPSGYWEYDGAFSVELVANVDKSIVPQSARIDGDVVHVSDGRIKQTTGGIQLYSQSSPFYWTYDKIKAFRDESGNLLWINDKHR